MTALSEREISVESDEPTTVLEAATRARTASIALRSLTRAAKDQALLAIADALVANSDRIVAVNVADTTAAREAGTA